MSELDIVIVLSKGLESSEEAFNFGKSIDNNFRLLYYRPLKDIGDKIYSERNKEQWSYYSNTPFFADGKGGHCWNRVEMPFHIYPSQPYFEEYVKNPRHRLSDDPKIDNLVVFFDDFYNNGRVFKQSVEDFVKLGYSREDLFFHSLTQYDTDKGSLTLDGNLNLWNLEDLRVDLMERLNQNN